MIKILTKIRAKITIIVVKNREPYYFIIIYKCKEVPLSLFSYQMLASLLTPTSGLVTIRSMNFTLFPAGTTNGIKNRMGCVIVIVCHDGNPYVIILLLFVNVNKAHYPYFRIRYWLQSYLWMSGPVTVKSIVHIIISLISTSLIRHVYRCRWRLYALQRRLSRSCYHMAIIVLHYAFVQWNNSGLVLIEYLERHLLGFSWKIFILLLFGIMSYLLESFQLCGAGVEQVANRRNPKKYRGSFPIPIGT